MEDNAGTRPITVVVADDAEPIREAISELVEREPSLRLVGSATDAISATEIAAREHPDVALLDVKMPHGGGPVAARAIRERSPGTRIVAFTAHDERTSVLQMLRAGASGYVLKTGDPAEVVDAIRRSVRGQATLAPDVTADIIHELVASLNRSEAATEALERVNAMKSEMVHVLSHELLTPISVIQGAASTLTSLGERLTPDDARELRSSIARASDRLRRLAGNLSAAARLDGERPKIDAIPVSIAEIVEPALDAFPASRGVISLVPFDERLRVWADQELAVRALIQVLENAIDFTAAEVEVAVRAGDRSVAMTVGDRGPGVSEADSRIIFEPLTQADGGLTRPHEGLGMGLYLARRIMEAHEGTVGVEPRPGGGSIFSLAFPLAPSA